MGHKTLGFGYMKMLLYRTEYHEYKNWVNKSPVEAMLGSKEPEHPW